MSKQAVKGANVRANKPRHNMAAGTCLGMPVADCLMVRKYGSKWEIESDNNDQL